jgi:hypothetical protein
LAVTVDKSEEAIRLLDEEFVVRKCAVFRSDLLLVHLVDSSPEKLLS